MSLIQGEDVTRTASRLFAVLQVLQKANEFDYHFPQQKDHHKN